MAWGAFSSLGTAGNKVAATSDVLTIANSSPAAGDIVIVRAMTDNLATVDGASSTLSCSDSKGNTYTKLGEQTNTVGGAAADGSCVAIWICQLRTGLTLTTDSITISYTGSITAKAIMAQTATITAGNTWASVGTLQRGTADAATSGPLLTLGGLPATEHVWISADAIEAAGAGTFTEDTNFVSALNRATSGGVANTNIAGMGAIRKASIASSTHQATYSNAGDWASLLVAVDEVTITRSYAPDSRRSRRSRSLSRR